MTFGVASLLGDSSDGQSKQNNFLRFLAMMFGLSPKNQSQRNGGGGYFINVPIPQSDRPRNNLYRQAYGQDAQSQSSGNSDKPSSGDAVSSADMPRSPFPGMSDSDYRGSMNAPGDAQMAEMKRRGYTHDQMVQFIANGAGRDYVGTTPGQETYGLSKSALNELTKNMPPDAFLQPTIPGTNMSWDELGDQPVGRMHAAWGKDSMDALRRGPPAWPMSSSYSQEMLPTERAQMGPLAPIYDLLWSIARPQTSYYDYGYPGSPQVFPQGVKPFDVTSSLTPANQAAGKNISQSQVDNLLASGNSASDGVSFGRGQ